MRNTVNAMGSNPTANQDGVVPGFYDARKAGPAGLV
jgi:hypothetical protein